MTYVASYGKRSWHHCVAGELGLVQEPGVAEWDEILDVRRTTEN